MCVFVSRPMKIATFLLKNDYSPKRVVDFPRERDTFRNKIMEIVEDFDEKSYNNNGKPWKSSRILRVKPNFFIFHCSSFFVIFFRFFIFSFFHFSFFFIFHFFLHFFIFSIFFIFHLFFTFPFFLFFNIFLFFQFFIFLHFSDIFFHFLSFSFIFFHFPSFSFIFLHFPSFF